MFLGHPKRCVRAESGLLGWKICSFWESGMRVRVYINVYNLILGRR